MLSLDEIQKRTEAYYSAFSATDLALVSKGLHFIETEERDRQLKGMGCRYSIYILERGETTIVSYSPRHRDLIQTIKEASSSSYAKAFIQHLQDKRKLLKLQLMRLDSIIAVNHSKARILTVQDYPLYKAFFLANLPTADIEDWLEDYFVEKAEQSYFTAYEKDGILLSVCDAPDMPYMEGLIQHTGIRTLADHRRKGYAKETVALATWNLIQQSVCPQWECEVDNLASNKLAESIGYRQYAKAYILED